MLSVSTENDEEMESLILYPNPNNGMFTVHYVGQSGNMLEISIVNMLGQIQYERQVHEFVGEITQQLDLNNVKPGIYMMRLQNGFEVTYKQFVITE